MSANGSSWTEDQIREIGRIHYPYPYLGDDDQIGVDCAGCPQWTGFDMEHIIKMLKESTIDALRERRLEQGFGTPWGFEKDVLDCCPCDRYITPETLGKES